MDNIFLCYRKEKDSDKTVKKTIPEGVSEAGFIKCSHPKQVTPFG